MKEEVIQASMQIILHAGDARLHIKHALQAIGVFDFTQAKQEVKCAQEKMREAHQIQTDRIQGEARGEACEYSLLFAHAQDTLMTIYSELNIVKQMIQIFKAYELRIAKLERERE